jgi:hypothetical protein
MLVIGTVRPEGSGYVNGKSTNREDPHVVLDVSVAGGGPLIGDDFAEVGDRRCLDG